MMAATRVSPNWNTRCTMFSSAASSTPVSAP